MPWIDALYKTYEVFENQAGWKKDKPILNPVAHSTAQAQIEVTIDVEGDFLRASEVSKDNALTLIPITEDSETRSGKKAPPHPLNDKLMYLAGDYDKYFRPQKSKADYHELYMEQLKKWADSEYSNEKVSAIYAYLEKNRLIADLLKEKVIILNENEKGTDHKFGTISQEDAFVRFIVEKKWTDPMTYIAETWKDPALNDDYVDYFLNQGTDYGICYITGENKLLSKKFPARIRSSGDKAKLISSNFDNTNSMTSIGRFKDSTECLSLSFDVSQKSHSALRWLIEKQGYHNGSECIVAWAIDGNDIPDPFSDSQNLIRAHQQHTPAIHTAQRFAEELNKAIAGYHADLTFNTDVVVMSVDTADGNPQGRLAITYYQELNRSEFLNNIKSWHIHGAWWRQIWDEEKEQYYDFYGVSSPSEMALAAYGIERENNNMKALSLNDKLKKNTIQRILPCIVTRKPFPKDIMLSAFHNTNRPLTMSYGNWNRILKTTCSMISLYYYTHKGEVINVTGLDKTCADRSYLFGRLLAAADYFESTTFGTDERQRVTNAKRYWNLYTRKPADTWKLLRERINPYLSKSVIAADDDKKKWSRSNYFNSVIDEISEKFDVNNGFSNDRLGALFILGYDHQMSAFWKSNNKVEEKEGK